MKLSRLKALVEAMEKSAAEVGNPDPTVEFYNDAERKPDNLTLSAWVQPSNVRRYRADHDGDAAKRGDFAIPLLPTSCI